MPRRKISIEEAFSVLQKAGINVQVKQAEPDIQQPERVTEKAKKEPIFPVNVTPAGPKTMKITLWAKHSVGSGGFIKGTGEEKRIEHAGVQTYGPGVCVVPAELAASLIYRDQQAKKADERMLDKTQRSYMVVKKYSSDGHGVDVGVEVSGDIFDDISSMPSNLMYRIR